MSRPRMHAPQPEPANEQTADDAGTAPADAASTILPGSISQEEADRLRTVTDEIREDREEDM